MAAVRVQPVARLPDEGGPMHCFPGDVRVDDFWKEALHC